MTALENAGEGNEDCIKYGADDNGKVLIGVDTVRQKEIIQAKTGNRVCPTVICRFCWKFPCYTKKWYDDMVQLGEEAEAHGLTDPKEIRYEIYAGLTRLVYGKLGAGNRKQIPYCMIAEIRDIYPAPNGNYVGFDNPHHPELTQRSDESFSDDDKTVEAD